MTELEELAAELEREIGDTEDVRRRELGISAKWPGGCETAEFERADRLLRKLRRWLGVIKREIDGRRVE